MQKNNDFTNSKIYVNIHLDLIELDGVIISQTRKIIAPV